MEDGDEWSSETSNKNAKEKMEPPIRKKYEKSKKSETISTKRENETTITITVRRTVPENGTSKDLTKNKFIYKNASE